MAPHRHASGYAISCQGPTSPRDYLGPIIDPQNAWPHAFIMMGKQRTGGKWRTLLENSGGALRNTVRPLQSFVRILSESYIEILFHPQVVSGVATVEG